MTIADTLTKRIGAEISALPRGSYGEVRFDEGVFAQLPEPDAFLSPGPDVVTGAEHPRIIEECAEHPTLLGVYVPMQSPGRILLVERNLRRFYWSLINQLRRGLPYLFPIDLEGALQLVVQQTYQHELFHFHCDVLRTLLGGRYDSPREEALAVAWSRLWIHERLWGTKLKRMNGVLYQGLMRAAYNYRSPGYRDWPQFADRPRFEPAFLDYVADSAAKTRLESNGVSNLRPLVAAMLGQITGGFVEEVV